MITSVRSVTPRLVTVRRPSNKSNGAVYVDREVVVVSTAADDPTERSAMYSTTPSSSDINEAKSDPREPSSYLRTSVFAQHMDVDRPASGSNHPRSSIRSFRRTSTRDVVLSENNRQSMKELANFLRTREPPPDHYMSIPESRELPSVRKRSSFNLFRRRKSQQPQGPKLLQLPDSAIASKTSGGHRHIAISIPIEHEYVASPSRNKSSGGSYADRLGGRNGLLLNPVRSFELPSPAQRRTPNVAGSSNLTETISIPNGGKTEFERHAHPQCTCPPKRGSMLLENPSLGTGPVVDPGVEFSPRSSVNKGLRHSIGPIYIDKSLPPPPHESRPTSTVPSLRSTYRYSLPPRTSSKGSARKPFSDTAAASNVQRVSGHKPTISGASAMSGGAESLDSIGSLHTAGVVDLQNFVGNNLRVRTKSNSSDHVGMYIVRPSTAPSTAPPERQLQAVTDMKKAEPNRSPTSIDSREMQLILASRQCRQERVRAKKQRDIEAHKEHGRSEPTQSENGLRPNAVRILTRSSSSLTRELGVKKRNANAITPIMVVAAVEPTFDYKAVSRNRSIKRRADPPLSHTPPRSSTSQASDEDTIARQPRKSMAIGSVATRARLSRRNSILSQHHKIAQEREADLDLRLSRIERDNTILLHTLNTLSRSFLNMNRLLVPSSRRENTKRPVLHDIGSTMGKEPAPVAGLDSIEPLMRELQDNARVSREEGRFMGPDEVEDEF
ncbi:hypothetical protein BP5796_01845 [Coleophoma crateriformis]|uniref:Uncharacterized protein n=1 Tax=Coleophoma crateriformis TaxID=565419 RepID=A0A3D8T200_9HELO|nr:hypothetical protein BP5796_01845 [Coleophoma crateriformis]